MALGAFTAWMCGARTALVRRAANGFVQLFRNTPPLVQLYFFYFALGPLLPKVGGVPLLGSFGWALVSLTLLEAAFVAEIFRAGIEAVPKAMTEAAQSLGYSRGQSFRLVVLPLALRITMPAMTNNLINLVKTTTLAYAIAVPELLYMSAQIRFIADEGMRPGIEEIAPDPAMRDIGLAALLRFAPSGTRPQCRGSQYNC